MLAIVDGLKEEALRAAVLPTGWTPLGLVEHLGYAERHWFQEVFTGTTGPLPWPDDEQPPLTSSRPMPEVFSFYADSVGSRTRSSRPLRSQPLRSQPLRLVGIQTRSWRRRPPIFGESCCT